MNILLLEEDPLVAALVDLVLTGSVSDARVRRAVRVAEAKVAWNEQPAQLVICDQHLSDGSGLELVKLIRSTDQDIPIVMISANSNREAVIAAARHGVSEFIAKPFDVAMLQQRLQPLLKAVAIPMPEDALLPDLDTWLAQALTEKLRLPTDLPPDAVMPLLARSDELSASELAHLWQKETILSVRLLNLANSASLKRSGKPVGRLDEAIAALGVDMALRTAMALALDITSSLLDERLIERAGLYLATAEQVATIARAMALSIGLDGLSCYTAGLLSRGGELAVLRTLQDFIARGGDIGNADIEALIAQWSPQYGNRLKQQWGLPLPVRELVGAIHMAPTHATQRPLLIMHLAGLRVASRLNGPEALRILRQSGLDVEKWQPKTEAVADGVPEGKT